MRRTPLIELFWKLHRSAYRWTQGRVGGRAAGLPVLLLTTRGRRSGEPRTCALTYLPRDEACVVIASHLGEPRHPFWWLNLEAQPLARVQVGSVVRNMCARQAEGAEREAIWDELIARSPQYAQYREHRQRRIPVVVLEPAAQGAAP
jgi:deazaflavin-dependent oxidoreductase (nitroreductase family)